MAGIVLVVAMGMGVAVEGKKSQGVECALCHAVAAETQIELDKTANSTEVRPPPNPPDRCEIPDPLFSPEKNAPKWVRGTMLVIFTRLQFRPVSGRVSPGRSRIASF